MDLSKQPVSSPLNRDCSGEPTLLPVDPRQRTAWRWSEIIETPFALVFVWLVESAIHGFAAMRWWPLPYGTLLALIVAHQLYAILYLPGRRYRNWAYALTDGELHVRTGIWTLTHTIVPLRNIQHVDTSQGPIERRFDLHRLIVHTAGSATANVKLPGLPQSVAVRMRDQIRALQPQLAK